MVHGELWTLRDLFVLPNEYVYWTILIVMYPFMTGLVAGAFVLSSLYHVFGVQQLRDIARFALVFSFALLPGALVPLLLHLQHPLPRHQRDDDAALHLRDRRLRHRVLHLLHDRRRRRSGSSTGGTSWRSHWLLREPHKTLARDAV